MRSRSCGVWGVQLALLAGAPCCQLKGGGRGLVCRYESPHAIYAADAGMAVIKQLLLNTAAICHSARCATEAGPAARSRPFQSHGSAWWPAVCSVLWLEADISHAEALPTWVPCQPSGAHS